MKKRIPTDYGLDLMTEWVDLMDQKKAPTIPDFLKRHPKYAEYLRPVLIGHLMIEAAMGRISIREAHRLDGSAPSSPISGFMSELDVVCKRFKVPKETKIRLRKLFFQAVVKGYDTAMKDFKVLEKRGKVLPRNLALETGDFRGHGVWR